MKVFTGIAISVIFLTSCKVAEQSIPGTYRTGNGQRTRLILHADKSFELALLDPATDSLIVHDQPVMNFFTTGVWEYDKKGLVLKTTPTASPLQQSPVDDSITRFSSISSFNFWNRYGDPISIRSIILPPMKTKPHFGNSLYYFSQDFKDTDTLKFFFEGYPPFHFPGTVPAAIGNNIHKVTLYEPYRPAAFPELHFVVRRNELLYAGNKLRFKRKGE